MSHLHFQISLYNSPQSQRGSFRSFLLPIPWALPFHHALHPINMELKNKTIFKPSALLSVYEERFLEQYSFSLAINPVFHGYSPSRDSRKLALGLRQSNELFVPESPCFSPKATTAPDLAGTTHSNMLPRKKKKMGQFKLS